jgi:MFS transporter, PAT family, beta-lactamase induction signal transducer AmpG
VAPSLFVRAAALGGLYLVQGLVYGFAAFILLPTLATRGVALEAQTGLLALAGLPWVLKLVWGPVIDGVFGKRRSPGATAAVAMVAIAMCAAALAIGIDGAAGFTTLALAWFVLNLALSLQDVATDALAFDVVSADERGRVQAVMLFGHHLGFEGLGGLWFAGVAASHGLGAPLWMIAIVALLIAGLPIAIGSSQRVADREPLMPVLRALLRDRRSRATLVLAAFVLVGDVVTYAVGSEFLIHRLGWKVEDLGAVLVPAMLVGSVVGFGIGGVLADRRGHARAAAWGSAALGLVWIGFAAAEPFWTAPGFMRAFVLVQAIPTAVLYAGVHAMLMDVLEPRVRATQYAVATACLNLPRAWAPLVAPALLGTLGFAWLYVACGLYQIAVVGLVFLVRPPAGASASQ